MRTTSGRRGALGRRSPRAPRHRGGAGGGAVGQADGAWVAPWAAALSIAVPSTDPVACPTDFLIIASRSRPVDVLSMLRVCPPAPQRCRSRASGVCSRTRNRPAWTGTRARVRRQTTTIVANASGTRPRGRLAQQRRRPARSSRSASSVHAIARHRAEPADDQPGDRAGVGEPAPPDAEQQQRAERRRGHRERQPDGAGDADVGREQRDDARHGHRHDRREPERR